MRFRPALAALLPFACLAAVDATPERHDTAAPINFAADHIEVQDKANRALLTGNVAVKQAEMTLDAARMTVAYTGQVLNGAPQVSRLDAAGNVIVRRPDQTARGAFGTYDLNRHLITMIGGVSLTQGANTINGARLTINLDTGRAVVDGSTVAGSGATAAKGGRVTGVFSVPQHDDAKPAPAATPAPGGK